MGIPLLYYLGVTIWNLIMSLVTGTITATPEAFSSEAWTYVTESVYPIMASIGATLLNLFFLIGCIRQLDNLREGLTLERTVEICIKLVFANSLMLLGIRLMRWAFDLSGWLGGMLLNGTTYGFDPENAGFGEEFLYSMFGLVFFLVCLICAVTIFLVVWGRYLQLFLLMATYPVAISTLPGGPGLQQTASAWVRTFLGKVFSIVIIALAIAIASRLSLSLDVFLSLDTDSIGGQVINGVAQCVQSMFNMILMAAAVKGADTFMHRTFNL